MYRCCAFGDCDITFDRCDIHHVLPWEIEGLDTPHHTKTTTNRSVKHATRHNPDH